MKYIKLYTLLMVSLLFVTSCSNDDKGTSNAIVNLPTQAMTVKENAGIFYVPVKVTGDHSNTIKAKFSVTAASIDPAVEDTNYIVTSKELVIPEGVDSVNVEIRAIDDAVINDNRIFTVNLVSVEGANMGQNTATVVTLRDNDANFYEKFAGKWWFEATTNKGDVKLAMTITAANEGDAKYDKVLNGSFSWDVGVAVPMSFPINYSYDKTTKERYLGLQCDGSTIVGTYGSSYSWVFYMYNESIDPENFLTGDIPGTWSDDYNTITFDKNYVLYLYQPGAGAWRSAQNIVLERQ